jgi:hypothetical protein
MDDHESPYSTYEKFAVIVITAALCSAASFMLTRSLLPVYSTLGVMTFSLWALMESESPMRAAQSVLGSCAVLTVCWFAIRAMGAPIP